MRRSVHTLALAVLIAITASAAVARSRDNPVLPPVLHEISALRVSVRVPDELTGVEASVRDALEAALDRGGLTIDRGNTSEPLPWFDLRVVAVADEGRFFYTILVKVTLRPAQGEEPRPPAPYLLWDAPPMVGIVGPDQFDILTSRAIHVAHQFLNEWEWDRERATDPAYDGSEQPKYDLYADD